MRAIFVAVIGLVVAGCVGAPPKKADLSGTAESRFSFALNGQQDEYDIVYKLLPLPADKQAAENACPRQSEPKAALPALLGAIVAAGVDWYFDWRQQELDAWKKAVSASYSKRINTTTRDELLNSQCLIAVRVDSGPTKGPGYKDAEKDLVVVFKIAFGDRFFTLTPVYMRAGRSVAATSVVDGRATIDTSFALSIKGIVGKADEQPELKELGSGTTTIAKVVLGAAGDAKALAADSIPTDMIPTPSPGVSPLSVTLAVSETGHPSDVDRLSAENKALQTALGAVIKAAVPSQ
jgi:hypothetical protein